MARDALGLRCTGIRKPWDAVVFACKPSRARPKALDGQSLRIRFGVAGSPVTETSLPRDPDVCFVSPALFAGELFAMPAYPCLMPSNFEIHLRDECNRASPTQRNPTSKHPRVLSSVAFSALNVVRCYFQY